jgi:hypothetical protein
MRERTQRRWLRTSLLALGKMGLAPRGDIFLGKCQQSLESLAKDKQLCVCLGIFTHVVNALFDLMIFDVLLGENSYFVIQCDTVLLNQWLSRKQDVPNSNAGLNIFLCMV